MRKTLFILLAISVLAGCNKVENPAIPEQDATELETKALYGQQHSTLTLQYENGNLVVDHANAMMNPCVKTGGVYHEITVDADVITIVVHERTALVPEPNCRIPHMTCTVPNLNLNSPYIVEYEYAGRTVAPIMIKFNKRLNKSVDIIEPSNPR